MYNVGSVSHNLVIPALRVDSPFIGQGGTWESSPVEIALEPGRYEFYCRPHRGLVMVGVLAVEP